MDLSEEVRELKDERHCRLQEIVLLDALKKGEEIELISLNEPYSIRVNMSDFKEGFINSKRAEIEKRIGIIDEKIGKIRSIMTSED